MENDLQLAAAIVAKWKCDIGQVVKYERMEADIAAALATSRKETWQKATAVVSGLPINNDVPNFTRASAFKAQAVASLNAAANGEMIESPAQTSLKTLTLVTIKTIATIEKLLKNEASPQRDKKILRALKELEVNNDEAMRVGLNASAQFIARAKTGRVRPEQKPTVDQQRGNDHRDLMKFHFEHIKGPIADGAAQGAALKWLLEHYSPDVLKQCYSFQTTEPWRGGRVSWLSVKSEIGKWLNNPRQSASKTQSSVDAARQVAAEFRQGTKKWTRNR